jgi:hypothetical protein
MLGAIGCGLVVGWVCAGYPIDARRPVAAGLSLALGLVLVGVSAGAAWFYEDWPGLVAALVGCALGAGLRVMADGGAICR